MTSLPPRHVEALFREAVLDHYRQPRNRRELTRPDADVSSENPFCGDRLRVQLRIEDGMIAGVTAQGQGCSISQAGGSIMTEQVLGRSLAEAAELAAAIQAALQAADDPPEGYGLPEALEALLGVRRFPSRVPCALLAWQTLEQALSAYHAAAG